MKKAILLLVSSLAFLPELMAQATVGQVYLRTGGTGYCNVIGASSATPIVVTVSAIGDCKDNTGALLTTGSRVSVQDVEGNLAANSYAGGDTSYAHLCRTVRAVSGNTFQLWDCDNANPIAGSGTYTGGGRVGHATRHTVNNAAYLAILQDPSRATASNPMYGAMQNRSAAHVAQAAAWGRGRQGPEAFAATVASAIRCRVDSNAGACAAARYDLQQVDQATITACDENYNRCGIGDRDADYGRQSSGNIGKAALLMVDAPSSALDATDKAKLADFLLGDKSHTVGGIGATGVTPTVRPWKLLRAVGASTVDISHGTVSWSSGSTNLTGSGTHWNTVGTFVDGHSEKIDVGDIVEVNALQYGTELCKVVAVVSDTSVTCSWPASATWTGVRYAVAPPWQAGDTGAAYTWSRFPPQYKNPNWSARLPNQTTESDTLNNLTHAGFEGSVQVGLATCLWTARGCAFAAHHWDVSYDLSLKEQMSIQGLDALNSTSTAYNGWRVNRVQLRLLWLAKNWLTPGESSLCAVLGAFCASGARSVTHTSTQHPGNGRLFFPQGEQYAGFSWDANRARPALYSSLLLGESDPDVKAFWDVAKNRMSTFNSSFPTNYVDEWYEGYDPDVVTATPSLVSPGPAGTGRAACAAIWGASNCVNFAEGPIEYNGLTSRSGWGTTDEAVRFVAASGPGLGNSKSRCIDHCGENAPSSLIVLKASKCLICNDNNDLYGDTYEQRGGLYLNGTANSPAFPLYTYAPVFSPWRFASSTAGAMRSVLTSFYKAAGNASYVERAIVHFPGSRIIIDWARMAQSSPGEQFQYHHFGLNGCGTAASSSCLSASIGVNGSFAADHGTAGVVGGFKGLRGLAVRVTSTGPDDFSFGGQNGTTGRVKLCPDSGSGCSVSQSTSEWVSAFGLTDGGTTTPPTVTEITNGALGGVQVTHGGQTAAALFTAGGSTVTSGSFTLSAAARFAVMGVAAGSYTVSGASCASTNVVATEHVLECTTAGAATVSFSQVGLPINIETTTPLPSGSAGISYSQSLAASGGTPAYTWDLASGSFAACGLTLSSAGVLSGATPLSGTCGATVRVTDSVGAIDTQALSVTIAGAAALAITTASLPSATVGVSYTASLAATGGTAPYAWAVSSGALCAGLALSSGGNITGTPSGTPGTCAFTGRVTDAALTVATRALSITLTSSATKNITFRFRRPSVLAADTLRIEYGATTGLGTSQDVACSVACSVTISRPSGAFSYRFRWLSGASPVSSVSRTRSITIP